MSSSISSSRKLYALMFGVITMGMGISMGLVRLFTDLNDASAETILDRVMEARAALPKIVEEEGDLMMSFGSSMTEAGFGARQFDRQMAERGIEIKSFNFGFGGLNPFFQDYLSRRVRDAFVENDRRLKLALVEFTPLQNTTSRYNGAIPAIDSFVTMLASDREIWDIVKDDPTRGIRMANIRWLRNDISAEMITYYFFGEGFQTPRPRTEIPPDEEKQKILEEIGEVLNARFEEDYPDYVDSEWSWEWQGAGTIPEERSEDTLELFEQYYDALRSDSRLDDDRLRRIHCCDIEELNFEEILIAAFIRTVQNFQEFSDHVEVILLPRNHKWIRRPPEAQERMRQVLERIHAETGVTIRSFEDREEFTPELFSDTTHLSRYAGDVTYTSVLVETYAPILAEMGLARAADATGE